MAEEQPKTRFGVQRLFTKNTSFESPSAPDIFRKPWKPEIKVDLNTKSSKLSDEAYEVVIRVTVTAKLEDQTAFLAEVEQGCIVTVSGMTDEQVEQMLGAYVPSVLFPYARETIDNMVVKGSFPPVMLAPVNFDALHQQSKQNKAAATNAEAN
ncbi:MAG: protein-export chaperone SecB [Natronospirillum sp.]